MERDAALSGLARLDFEEAARVAPALLSASDPHLRFRAAWILADGGSPLGLKTLREMAADLSSDLTLPIDALGRLRDAGSHALLRGLLSAELKEPNSRMSRPRIDALAASLSEFSDAEDTALIIQAATQRSAQLVTGDLEALQISQAGSRQALPILEQMFEKTGRGWAVMAAGLGMARCGSETGRRYVLDRLADDRGCRSPAGFPQDSRKDDPVGPRATCYLLSKMGAPSDETFVPELMRIAGEPAAAFAARAAAWQALVRIDSPRHRAAVLELAWKASPIDGAAKYIAQSAAIAGARTRLSARDDRQAPTLNPTFASLIEKALSTTPREQRHWRERHGYAF